MSILTKEVIQKILNDDWLLMDDCEGLENCTVIKELARMALAALDSEPVSEVVSVFGDSESIGERELKLLVSIQNMPYGTKFYRHAQPAQTGVDDDVRNIIGLLETNEWAEHCTETVLGSRLEAEITRLVGSAQPVGCRPAPVVLDDIKLRELFDSWFASDCSFDRSPEASEEDNIAWRESYWYVWQRCRAAMLQAGNCRENANSSTKHFREISETSTRTAITPAAPDKKLTDDVLDEIIAGAKTSMEQHLALSLKAEREVWRKEGPTDDERIMAIEGIHNCEQCGDEGWVVGEMGITRCACGQAVNSPVIPDGLAAAAPTGIPMIPDGYVMVPKEPTKEMIDAGWLHFMGTKNPSSKGTYKAMLAAAPQEVPDEK